MMKVRDAAHSVGAGRLDGRLSKGRQLIDPWRYVRDLFYLLPIFLMALVRGGANLEVNSVGLHP